MQTSTMMAKIQAELTTDNEEGEAPLSIGLNSPAAGAAVRPTGWEVCMGPHGFDCLSRRPGARLGGDAAAAEEITAAAPSSLRNRLKRSSNECGIPQERSGAHDADARSVRLCRGSETLSQSRAGLAPAARIAAM